MALNAEALSSSENIYSPENLHIQAEEIKKTKEETLVDAAEKGDIKKMQELLSEGANVNGADNTCVPLRMAASYGHIEAVQFLLSQGAHVDHPDQFSNNSSTFQIIIFLACAEGLAKYKDILDLLLKHKADINRINAMGFRALTLAACTGNIEVLRFMLENGASIPRTDPFGLSYLLVILKTCETMVQTENGQVVRELHPQHFERIKAVMSLFIAHGFDINFQSDTQYITIPNPNQPILDNDNNNDNDINIQDQDHHNLNPENPPQGAMQQIMLPLSGYSPLMLACEMGHIPLVSFIISQGANVNQRGGYLNTETPLTIAASKNNFPLVEFLIEKAGAEPNPLPMIDLILNNPLPLMYAYLHKNLDMMIYLIAMGAGASAELAENVKNHIQALSGAGFPQNLPPEQLVLLATKWVFDYACSETLPANISLKQLFNAGAHLNQRTTLLSNTPLHLACINNKAIAAGALIQELKNEDEVSQIALLMGENREGHTALDVAAMHNMKTANIIRNFLQPIIDHHVFEVQSRSKRFILPAEILQEIFTMKYSNFGKGRTRFANTCAGIALVSEMFDLARKHFIILCERHNKSKELKPLLQPLVFSLQGTSIMYQTLPTLPAPSPAANAGMEATPQQQQASANVKTMHEGESDNTLKQRSRPNLD